MEQGEEGRRRGDQGRMIGGGEIFSNSNKSTTGLPAYSDIPATVTVFGSIKGSPYTENPGYSDIPLTVTLFGCPNTVTVSGEACITICENTFHQNDRILKW